MEPSIADWVALNMLPGLGTTRLRRALEVVGDPYELAYRVPPHRFLELGNWPADLPERIETARRNLKRRVEDELRLCGREGVSLIVQGHPDYPALLSEIADPPLILYVRGRLRPEALRFAVVGSRRATGGGLRAACGLAGGLAARGVEIVSGGARGVDTLAHKGALDSGGRTVAVMGHGLAHTYPGENRELFRQIASKGAVVSEFPMSRRVRREAFARRNRLISGLCRAVIVVEAAAHSGSLITARHALDQGREVLAIPGSVENPNTEGCHRLIQQGAKLVHCIEDILEELPSTLRGATLANPQKVPEFEPETLPGDERALWDLLDPEKPAHLDELAGKALFGIPRLQAALIGLDFRGLVEQLPGGYYIRRFHRSPKQETS